jgi:hypothetical protein
MHTPHMSSHNTYAVNISHELSPFPNATITATANTNHLPPTTHCHRPQVDVPALATRVAKGEWRVDPWWSTYDGANVASVAGIDIAALQDGDDNDGTVSMGLPSSSLKDIPLPGQKPGALAVSHVHRSLLTQPIHIHSFDVEGPFSRPGAAEDQIVCSATRVFHASPHLLLWNRLGALLRTRDDRVKVVALRIVDTLIRAGRSVRLWRLGYHLARARIEATPGAWSPDCLGGGGRPQRSLPRVVTIVVLRHRLQSAGTRVATELAHDFIDLLRSINRSVGAGAADVLKLLAAQPVPCQQLLASDCFIKTILYACQEHQLASEIAVSMRLAVLRNDAELYRWMMVNVKADPKKSVVHSDNKRCVRVRVRVRMFA